MRHPEGGGGFRAKEKLGVSLKKVGELGGKRYGREMLRRDDGGETGGKTRVIKRCDAKIGVVKGHVKRAIGGKGLPRQSARSLGRIHNHIENVYCLNELWDRSPLCNRRIQLQPVKEALKEQWSPTQAKWNFESGHRTVDLERSTTNPLLRRTI